MSFIFRYVCLTVLLLCLFPFVGCNGTFGEELPSHAPHTVSLDNVYGDIAYYKSTARMEVRNVTFGFMPDPERPLVANPAIHGNQFVRVELAFVNTGQEPFSMRYTNISLSHSAKSEAAQTFMIRETNVDDLLKSADIPVGGEVSGAMYFEVPQTDTLEDLSIHYNGYDGQSLKYTIDL